MKRQFRFTKRSLDALPPCPANSASKEWNGPTSTSGPAGSGQPARPQELPVPLPDPRQEARDEGRRLSGNQHRGSPPEGDRVEGAARQGHRPAGGADALRETGITFREFFEQYLWPHIVSTKRSARADESRYRNHVLPAFGHREMTKITTLELQRFHNDNKAKMAPASSNRIFELIRHAYTWREAGP
jgi:hypothetical protein